MSDHLPGQLADWIGRTSRSQDVVTERLDASFRAVLAPYFAPVSDGQVPLGLHWCLCPAIAEMTELGSDGHPAKNRDLPPVPLPRRMWAGGMIETFDALRVGDAVTRISTISDVTHKQGRSGELWFVTVTHQYETVRGIAIRDRQDIVYRGAADQSPAKASAPIAPPSPSPSNRHWTMQTSPVLLFRYSAITFNGHRIHYDHPYATGVEGYDGLVVHGPMQATLLLNLAAVETGRTPQRFSYRGVAPAIAGAELMVCRDANNAQDYWTESDGKLHMKAKAELS
ncbi:MaoC family dehydratase N-terminal domain-containing protein [Mesorhizobium sp. KR9-304]|uniref:FAS1-like dehydratase domain-containing protein n=1 Tax=Mesorhizobium sp. KR9-304 TaxID=3156614 RepID=UPI0032B35300